MGIKIFIFFVYFRYLPLMTIASSSKPRTRMAPSRPEPWDLVEVSPLVDLRDLNSIVRRRRVLLVTIPVLCVLLALVYLFFLATPMYLSSALIFVDPKVRPDLPD